MKIEFEPQDVQQIADKVVEMLRPFLRNDEKKGEIFDKKALAKYLLVPISWVDKNIHILPRFNVGKYVRFKKSYIDRWMETKKVMLPSYSLR